MLGQPKDSFRHENSNISAVKKQAFLKIIKFFFWILVHRIIVKLLSRNWICILRAPNLAKRHFSCRVYNFKNFGGKNQTYVKVKFMTKIRLLELCVLWSILSLNPFGLNSTGFYDTQIFQFPSKKKRSKLLLQSCKMWQWSVFFGWWGARIKNETIPIFLSILRHISNNKIYCSRYMLSLQHSLILNSNSFLLLL